MKKITKKQMYEMIKTAAETKTWNEELVESVIAFCAKQIEILENKSVASKARAAEKKAAEDAISSTIYGILTDEAQTIAAITAAAQEACPNEEVTPSKVSYRLNALTKGEEPYAIGEEKRIDGRVLKVYRLA